MEVGVCGGLDVAVDAFCDRVDVGARSVLIAVKKIGVLGVLVNKGPPVSGTSGHSCKATGNNRQLELSEQIFRLKLVSCMALQTSTRLPL